MDNEELEKEIQEALANRGTNPETPVIELDSDEEQGTGEETTSEEEASEATTNDDASTEESTTDESATEHKSRKDRRIERLLQKLSVDDAEPNLKRPDPYKPLELTEDGDYELKQLEEDRLRLAQSTRQQGEFEGYTRAQDTLRAELFADKLEADKERVEIKYPELDQESDNFDPDLASSVNRLYLKTVGYKVDKAGQVKITNPTVRYTDFVDGFIAIAERIAETRNAETATNVAKQAAKQGIRPTGGGRKTLALTPENIANMSDADFAKNKDAINQQVMKLLGQ